jgi:hypothetical protein
VFTVAKTSKKDGGVISFGPPTSLVRHPLAIAQRFSRSVSYENMGISLEIEFLFDGDKVQIQRLVADGGVGYVGSRDLTQLSLPAVTREAAISAIPNAKFWLDDYKEIQFDKASDLTLLAQLYWFEHVTWGSPRVAIQEFLGCKRTTANYYIRLVSALTPLPGQHKISAPAN